MPRIVLPTFYYHDHFMEMINSVVATYTHVLKDKHRKFIMDFRALTRDEQCLYIRMTNRKGVVFHRSSLTYAEINQNAYQGLLDKSFTELPTEASYLTILYAMTKDQLLEIAESAMMKNYRPSWHKSRLADHVAEHLPFPQFQDMEMARNFVIQRRDDAADFIIYLYFGKSFDDLKSFALRDLKIVRVQDGTTLKSRFSDALEAESCFIYSTMIKRLRLRDPLVFQEGADTLHAMTHSKTDYARQLLAKAAYNIGQHFEKQKYYPRALAVYRLSDFHECNERVVRVEYTHGDKEIVKKKLEGMIDDPASDDEYVFASDFYARKFGGKRAGACLELLRAGNGIVIDDIHRSSPEYGAVSYFHRNGWSAYRTENELWHCVFGLLFWDELYGSGDALHSAFDTVPHCLRDGTFTVKHADQIAAKLAAVRAGNGLIKIVKTIATAKGKPNGIFGWYYLDIDAIRDLFKTAQYEAIASILQLMTEDYIGMRDGFPDLMLIKGKTLKFVEIKGEGDLVRKNQLTRLHQLKRAGFEAEICRVAYQFDPEQVYVVVDIETTGGMAAYERITEIGAVKIRNHEIIGEWQSLINPQRRIPAGITALTGITDEMVATAPTFSEISDQFMEFMGDGIFVAHNVNFDYGFISEEYRRIDKTFKFPKFCTVANMRRQFPGQFSYSLGYLCERYEIPLHNHHRAMDDAKAAAHLLNKINGRREETPVVIKERETA